MKRIGVVGIVGAALVLAGCSGGAGGALNAEEGCAAVYEAGLKVGDAMGSVDGGRPASFVEAADGVDAALKELEGLEGRVPEGLRAALR